MEKTYRIGEVAQKLKIRTSALRYWEKEFAQVLPARTHKGQRYYTEDNIAVLMRIRSLLHDEGMKIEGVRKLLESEKQIGQNCGSQLLENIQSELGAIRNLLSGETGS